MGGLIISLLKVNLDEYVFLVSSPLIYVLPKKTKQISPTIKSKSRELEALALEQKASAKAD